MAPPPPATPTPSRFLLSKRQGNPQNASGKQEVNVDPQIASSDVRRFHATPRFSSTSRHAPTQSHHVPVFSTPSAAPRSSAVPSAGRARGSAIRPRTSRNVHSDIIESSPEPTSSPEKDEIEGVEVIEVSEDEKMRDDDDDDDQDQKDEQVDAIEVHSSSPPRSPLPSSWPDEEPAAKRRRISISPPVNSRSQSPQLDTPSRLEAQDGIEDEVELQNEPEAFQPRSGDEDTELLVLESDDDSAREYQPKETTAFAFDQPPIDYDPELGEDDGAYAAYSPSSSYAGEPEDSPILQDPSAGAVGNPTFRQAPRFKGSEPQAGEQATDGAGPQDGRLPDALFTPQRRGAKYVAGGLAAELRDWLVHIKGGSGGHEDGATSGDMFSTQLVVDQVEAAPGMHIMHGRPISSDTDPERSEHTSNVILAGDGRLDGLARPRDVVKDSHVGIAQPSWEVVLDGGTRWTVACDWAVIE